MKSIVFALVLAYAVYFIWRLSATEDRAAANRFAKRHLIALAVITVLVVCAIYSSWLFALNGPTLKFL